MKPTFHQYNCKGFLNSSNSIVGAARDIDKPVPLAHSMVSYDQACVFRHTEI